MDWSLLLALLAGAGIAAACGLRAFLPLLLLGIASRLGWLELQPQLGWLDSNHALWSLGIAAVLEIAADKIPVVDHALDLLGTIVRPAAGWLGATAVLTGLPMPWAPFIGLGLAGGSLVVQGLKAKVRLGSTAATAGHANPFLSAAEDLISFGAVVVAIVMPLLVLLLVLGIVWLASRWRRLRPRAAA